MTRRSRGREVALQLLFERDQNTRLARDGIEQFVRDRIRDPELRVFCLSLYDGVTTNLIDIDTKLTAAAENWRLVRMSTVDRNVLRIGAFELLYTPDTPSAVALDEAIELARRFGTADSSAFVNGILDKIRLEAAPTP
jgi:N utilization substance protein B